MASLAPESPAAYPTVDEIIDRIDAPLTEEQTAYVHKAYQIAERAHATMRRASGEPYFSHCAEVAILLADLVSDWATICAGLLHDVIEDCGMTRADLAAEFPDPVPNLVDGVTKISSIHFVSDREQQADNLRKMILAMASDVRVVLIKLCDRLHNMRTLEYLSEEKQKRISEATIEIYAPLAGRLGMERISHELQDLALRYQHSVIYGRLSQHLDRNRARYENTIEQTRKALTSALDEEGIKTEISGRLKHIFSLYRKMQSQALELREIHDLIAIRVIAQTVADCYAVLGIVHSLWKPLEGRFKDYIASPKPNGYESIHTTVIGVEGELCEIQIRTRAMHKIANDGVAAHWSYKESGSARSAAAQEADKVAWLRQLMDWLADVRDPDEFMAAVKQGVFEDSVFCYTPQGDVIEMHSGSTVLDFAYRIHTEVGAHCTGARVNHKMASIRTRIATGDIIEIVTTKAAHPTRDWLRIATSSRARNKIRHWLKTNDREHYLERGRRILLEDLRAKYPDVPDKTLIEEVGRAARHLSLKSGEDVIVEVGFGSLKAGQVSSKLAVPGVAPVLPAPVAPMPRRKKIKKVHAPDTIIVDGIAGTLTRIAKCCSPEPGDPILGYVTIGRGISVHRADCPSLARTLEVHAGSSGRVVTVEWGDGSGSGVQVELKFECYDRQRLLNDITQAMVNFDVNILEVRTSSNLKTGTAEMRMKVRVAHEDDLDAILRRLGEVPSVIKIRRVDPAGK